MSNLVSQQQVVKSQLTPLLHPGFEQDITSSNIQLVTLHPHSSLGVQVTLHPHSSLGVQVTLHPHSSLGVQVKLVLSPNY